MRGKSKAPSKSRSAPFENGNRRAATSQAYLAMLGERVRDARARHGMTRKMLAHDAKISERYLAQLEGGRGNFSIVLMRRLAAALDVAISELVSDEPQRPIEYTLIVERLRRLDSAELGDASTLLAKRFGDRSGRYANRAGPGLARPNDRKR